MIHTIELDRDKLACDFCGKTIGAGDEICALNTITGIQVYCSACRRLLRIGENRS